MNQDKTPETALESIQRREALKTLGAAAVTLFGSASLGISNRAQAQEMSAMSGMMGMGGMSSQAASVQPGLFNRPLPIPPQLQGVADAKGVLTYALKASGDATTELVAGFKTPTWGYNGAVLGPTVRIPQGKPVRVHISNTLNQPTTVHWHGAQIPGNVDGGPHNKIEPQQSITVAFTLNQPAATLWYHPHIDRRTGPQVFAGLAGLVLIDDGADVRLGMPHTYGIDDIPLILQDRRLNKSGGLDYMSENSDIMGMKGNHFLVNGTEQPYVTVPAQWLRLRLLNGSNARLYNLAFADHRAFHVIASDAGLLEHPVETKSLLLAPGERAEIMLDLSRDQGKKLVLGSDSASLIPSLSQMPMGLDGLDQSHFDLLELRVGAPAGTAGKLPNKMATIPVLKSDMPSRQFMLQDMSMGMMQTMMGGGTPTATVSTGPGAMSMGVGGKNLFSINGQFMNMTVINQRVRLGSTEVWEIANKGGMPHPFHVHGISFQILTRDGVAPAEHERGWKDVVLVHAGQRVQIIAHFNQPAGVDHPFMYHCHILEHEDNGMMGQFTVI